MCYGNIVYVVFYGTYNMDNKEILKVFKNYENSLDFVEKWIEGKKFFREYEEVDLWKRIVNSNTMDYIEIVQSEIND